jgi:hypothetical protein
MHKSALCLVLPMMLAASATLGQTSGLQLSISTPADGDVVPRRLTVSGTSAGLSTNRILVFVYAPAAERWFFQGEATVAADGAWTVEQVVISGGAIRTAGGAERPGVVGAGVQIVATAMNEIPPGLSGVPTGSFPPSGTRAQSPIVVVTRGE